MKAPFYYRIAITLAKPIYRMLLSFNSEKRDTVGVVSQADEFAMRYARQFPPKHLTHTPTKPCIWVHAVSLGETNTIAPIIERFISQGYEVVITNTTHTGYARSLKLFSSKAHITFIPVDAPKQLQKFIDYYQPKLAVFVETELWANALALLTEQRIASLLVNARLTEKSFNGYKKFAKVSQSMMTNLSHVICQDEQSAERFHQLGLASQKLSLAPSLKFAVPYPTDKVNTAALLKQEWQLTKKIIVAASTHDGEEGMILAVFETLQQAYDDIVLIIVPRHPERFESVAGIIEEKNYTAYRRSADDIITADTQVYLADSMGELSMWYAMADIALVAGSFVPNIGGHNPLEASILGKPVIMGQYTEKCQFVVNTLVKAEAMQVVNDHQALYDALFHWLEKPDIPLNIGTNGKTVMQANQNTVDEQYALITPYLP